MTPETPSTPTVEQPQTIPETQLSPEVKQQQEILSMLESKYKVDLKSYIEDQSRTELATLRQAIQNPNQAKIEQRAKEIYEAYLKSEIEKPG